MSERWNVYVSPVLMHGSVQAFFLGRPHPVEFLWQERHILGLKLLLLKIINLFLIGPDSVPFDDTIGVTCRVRRLRWLSFQ